MPYKCDFHREDRFIDMSSLYPFADTRCHDNAQWRLVNNRPEQPPIDVIAYACEHHYAMYIASILVGTLDSLPSYQHWEQCQSG
jgi:hypothetical protein